MLKKISNFRLFWKVVWHGLHLWNPNRSKMLPYFQYLLKDWLIQYLIPWPTLLLFYENWLLKVQQWPFSVEMVRLSYKEFWRLLIGCSSDSTNEKQKYDLNEFFSKILLTFYSSANTTETVENTQRPIIPAPDLDPNSRTITSNKRARTKTMLPCRVCSKTFDRPSLLKRHHRTHTGEKPHVCDVCKKGFSTSSSLNTHR